MGNIFSNLESLGLGKLSDLDIFEKEGEEKKMNQKVNQPKESDFIFDKSYKCPVCDLDFKSKAVKIGKVRLLSADTDLRPKYQLVDSIKYDVAACPRCGFAALNRYFTYLTAGQIKLIQDNISIKFSGIKDEGEIWSYDDSITRHQLALLNAVVKKSKISERAFICLKTAWIYRGKAENLPDDLPDRDKTVEELNKIEIEYINRAYIGFLDAFGKEVFPMCGMDEHTLTYLVADLARRTGRLEEALKHLSSVLVSRDANQRVKDKARDLREIIKIARNTAEGRNVEGTNIHNSSK